MNVEKELLFVKFQKVFPITENLDSSRWTGPSLPRITGKLGIQRLLNSHC